MSPAAPLDTPVAVRLGPSYPPDRHLTRGVWGRMCPMGIFDRLRGRSASMKRTSGGYTTVRTADDADTAHLDEFVRTRTGVEAFLEPRTAVSDVTVVLVAHDGEWTRRRVPSTEWAHKFA